MNTEHNNSPWLSQLVRTRPMLTLNHDHEGDIAVVGGGIAGIATAYFLLRDTGRSVVVVEADEVASGATGHNAGQVVSYFERSFASIVDEFGLKRAGEGQQAINSAWDLLDEIYKETTIQTPLSRFTGYAGCRTIAQVLPHLENNLLRKKAGLEPEKVLVANSIPHEPIPERFAGLYELVPQQEILEHLETTDTSFIASLASLKGCLNSAAFTEELATFLTTRYEGRIAIFEKSPVRTVRLHKDKAELQIGTHVVTVRQVILCTNGFEHFTIENTTGPDINTEFHHMVSGSIGYMAAYIDPEHRPASAVSYFSTETADHPPASQKNNPYDADPYFYVTRRLFYQSDPKQPNLVCIGGPEQLVKDTSSYSKKHPFSADAKKMIDAFLRRSYKHTPKGDIPYSFLWHGLMGYTPNGIRKVGFEPHNPVLLYNLGCNGVGILPSLYGGKRIAQLVRGETLPPSIFDTHPKAGPSSMSGQELALVMTVATALTAGIVFGIA